MRKMLTMGLGVAMLLGATGCGDDVESDGLLDAGMGDAGTDARMPLPDAGSCSEDDDCDNGLFCDGEEVCEDGSCVRGVAPDCDDGVACTEDFCSESMRSCRHLAADRDNDGHGDIDCLDTDGEPLGDDCDDLDPRRYPGRLEVCDGQHHDEDCDPSTFGAEDRDRDGFISAQCCNAASDAEDAELICGDDCDDLKKNVNPMATEACDHFDNDCDGETDENVSVMRHPDADFDGHGEEGSSQVRACPGDSGFAQSDDDCNDDDPAVFAGQLEICDGKDNDCDETTDEATEPAPWYVDDDGDGFGDATQPPTVSCTPVNGHVLLKLDCDDSNASVHPGATEICDAVDNDCDGRADYVVGTNDFEDDDGDGLADAQCGGTDCDDRDPATGDASEICDGKDNDCDDAIDEDTSDVVWYVDDDGDGFGTAHKAHVVLCEPVPQRSSVPGDCNDDPDDDGNVDYPGAPERCDGKDNDCDFRVDEGADASCSNGAVASCDMGSCVLDSCLPGFGNCDMDASNGCEVFVGGSDCADVLSGVTGTIVTPPTAGGGSGGSATTINDGPASPLQLDAHGEGEPIANARIEIGTPTATLVAFTNANGEFTLEVPSDTTLTMSIQGPPGSGLIGMRRSFRVPPASLNVGHVELRNETELLRGEFSQGSGKGLLKVDMFEAGSGSDNAELVPNSYDDVFGYLAGETSTDNWLPYPGTGPYEEPGYVLFGNVEPGTYEVGPEGTSDGACTVVNQPYSTPLEVEPGIVTLATMECSFESSTSCCTPRNGAGCTHPDGRTLHETDVCDLDPYCCDTAWDSTCVAEAEMLGICPVGDCCTANGTRSCSQQAVTACVCSEMASPMPSCCDTEWTQECVDAAIANCSLACG